MARETGGLCLGHYGHKGCHALIVVKTKMKIFGAHNISIVLYIGVHATFLKKTFYFAYVWGYLLET